MANISWTGYWRGATPDGREHQRAREIVRPTGRIVRGKFPSRKCGRMVHYEGSLESDALYLFETSPRIVRYTEQPETIRYADGARLRRYTPDFCLTLSSGATVLVEVKPCRYAMAHDTKQKLDQVADYFRRHAQRFCILTEVDIRTEPRLSSLRWIYHSAPRIHGSPFKATIVLRRLLVHFPMTIGDAVTSLASHGLEPYSLLMAGILFCRLDEPVNLNTLVHLNLENSHEPFLISDQYDF